MAEANAEPGPEAPEAPRGAVPPIGREARRSVTVVTILREPLEPTLRFVAWYLELGAARLDLYFDDPDDPAIARLEAEPRVSCTRCTPEFWRGLGLEPDERFTLRQNRVLSHAYAACDTGWVLNVDADEFLWLGPRSLPRFAARQPDEVRAVRVQPAEVVQLDEPDGATWFRMPMRRRHLRSIYKDDRALFRLREGMVGHVDGKSMIRTGLMLSAIRQHWAEDADKLPIKDKMVGKRQQAVLLHFLDGGYDHWRSKVEWRAASAGFNGRIRQRLNGQTDEAPMTEDDYRELYRRLHCFDAERRDELEASGRFLRLEDDFDAPRRRLFGDPPG